jgi:hypothetical protein
VLGVEWSGFRDEPVGFSIDDGGRKMSEPQESQLSDVSVGPPGSDLEVDGASPPAASSPAQHAEEAEGEGLEFPWSKVDAKIYAAVEAYCEETYADY